MAICELGESSLELEIVVEIVSVVFEGTLPHVVLKSIFRGMLLLLLIDTV